MLEDTHAFPVILTLLLKLFIQRGDTTLLSSWPSPSFLILYLLSFHLLWDIPREYNKFMKLEERQLFSFLSGDRNLLQCSQFGEGFYKALYLAYCTPNLIGILMVQAWHLWCIWLANQSSWGCYHQDRF